MSLDFDIREIPTDVKWVGDEETGHLNPKTQTIIFACIPTDIGQITEDNYKEFYLRYLIFNTTAQPIENRTRVLPVNLQDIKDHIGLKVNVVTISRHAWLKRLGQFMDSTLSDSRWRESHPL